MKWKIIAITRQHKNVGLTRGACYKWRKPNVDRNSMCSVSQMGAKKHWSECDMVIIWGSERKKGMESGSLKIGKWGRACQKE